MSLSGSDYDWQTLLSLLPPDFEDLAVSHKQLNTQWSNAKIPTAAMLLRFIFLHVGADLPLRQTVALVVESGGPDLSAVRLHHRMRRAQPYLAALVSRMMPPVGAEPELWHGYEMVCVDATAVCGPGAEGTDARLHAVIRLHDLAVTEVEVTDVTGGETFRRFPWTPGQLVIADRGYSTPPGIAWIVDQGADVLVRVNRGALPLQHEDGTPIDVLELVRQFGGHAAVSLKAQVVVHAGKKKQRLIGGRLVCRRLPEDKAEEARQRVRREHGSSTSSEQLEAAGFVILFTTAEAERLSPARCLQAYTLRWQVELLFKRWKSLCHFDRLPNYRDDTIQSWLTAKLLLALLLDSIGSQPTAATQTSAPTLRSIAHEPWKLTSILWPMIVAAILPLGLHDALSRVPMLVERLDTVQALESRQLSTFRRHPTVFRRTAPRPNC